MNKNIILIGFMGCGKSTVGKMLSSKLQYELIDADAYIETALNMKISEIFAKYGEKWFREQESFALECMTDGEKRIIATGGGAVETPGNREILKKGGTVVYLKSTVDRLWSRVGNDPKRPLSKDLNGFMRLFNKRKPVYEEWADIIIDTAGKNPQAVVDEIMIKINNL